MHNPDAVVVATGSVPVIPTIPGIDKRNVVVAVDLLKNNEDTGKHIIVVGGGLVGCETALHLAQKGKSVTVIDKLPEIAQDVIFMAMFSLLQALAEKSITTEASLELMEITDK